MRQERRRSTRNSMKRKRKRRRPRSAAHLARYHRGIVQTPLRLAFQALAEPRLNGGRHWVMPWASEVMARLSNGRASESLVRHWLNGTRRAPAWFIAVLDSELQRRADHILSVRQLLARYEPRDPERDKAIKAARAREQIRQGIGAIGARKRASEARNEDSAGKNDPHN